MRKHRILFMTYLYPTTFEKAVESSCIGGSWIEALVAVLKKDDRFVVANILPIVEDKIMSKEIDGVTYYGVPAKTPVSILEKVKAKINYSIESEEIVDYAKEVVDMFKPTIIQVFGSENPFGLIAEKTDIPVVVHLQGFLNVWKYKWFSALSREEQHKYTSLYNRVTLKRGTIYEYKLFEKRAEMETRVYKSCRYFLGRTAFDRRVLTALNPDAKYFHCEEMIRKEFFENKWKDCFSDDVLNCVSIIRGTPYKGIDLLVKTAIVLRSLNINNVKFNVIGVYENEEFVSMVKKSIGVDYEDLGIKFVGRLYASDIIPYLTQSDIYIHPSYIENSPNSVCEAMALGMPIISTNTGGLEDLIKTGYEGVLVQEGEPYSMAGAIIEMSRDIDKAREMGKNAAIRAAKRHDPAKTVENLYNIYEEILKENE